MRSVAVTGASSLTGMHIAAAFHAAGWRVYPLLTRAARAYAGLPAMRVARLPAPISAGTAESGALAAWAREARPEIWVHHHHWMVAYRSPEYDAARADTVGLAPLEGLIDALAASGCRGILHSGTMFEPGEGGHGRTSPYGESKARAWTALRASAMRRGLAVGKVVIPNPIGPLENADRLIPVLLARAQAGEPIVLSEPGLLSDHLPADVLGRRYVALAERLLAGATDVVARPSGRRARMRDWVEEVQRELIVRRLGLAAIPPRAAAGGDSGVPACNPPPEAESIDWPAFWDAYAQGTSIR